MRIALYLAIVCTAFFFPFWVFAVCAALYALRWSAYEFLPLAILIDATFGVQGLAYLYTVYIGVVCLVIVYLRPLFVFYDESI